MNLAKAIRLKEKMGIVGLGWAAGLWGGDLVLGLAEVISTSTSLCGGPFASRLYVSHRNYYLALF